MPEPTPTTDVAPEVNQGKKIPKWGYIVIIGVGVVGLLWYKKHRAESEQSTEFQPAETGGQNLEQTIPASSGTGGAGFQALQKENTEFLSKFLETEQAKPKTPVGNQIPNKKQGREPGSKTGNQEKPKEEPPVTPPVKVEVPKVPPPLQEPFEIKKPQTPVKRKGVAPPKLQPVGRGQKPLP